MKDTITVVPDPVPMAENRAKRPPVTVTEQTCVYIDPQGKETPVMVDGKVVKQLHITHPKPKSPKRLGWIEDAENHLREHGWEMTGVTDKGMSLWRDPKGSSHHKAEMKQSGVLPLKGGGTEPLLQLYIPPLDWEYTLDQALSIQWNREHNGTCLDALIESKKAEIADLVRRREIQHNIEQLAQEGVTA